MKEEVRDFFKDFFRKNSECPFDLGDQDVYLGAIPQDYLNEDFSWDTARPLGYVETRGWIVTTHIGVAVHFDEVVKWVAEKGKEIPIPDTALSTAVILEEAKEYLAEKGITFKEKKKRQAPKKRAPVIIDPYDVVQYNGKRTKKIFFPQDFSHSQKDDDGNVVEYVFCQGEHSFIEVPSPFDYDQGAKWLVCVALLPKKIGKPKSTWEMLLSQESAQTVSS